MALLDSLLGGSLLGGLRGGLLGGGASARGAAEVGGAGAVDNSAEVGIHAMTNPSLDLTANEQLKIEGGGGLLPDVSVGGLGLGLSAPTFLGVSISDDSSVGGPVDGSGALLGGLT